MSIGNISACDLSAYHQLQHIGNTLYESCRCFDIMEGQQEKAWSSIKEDLNRAEKSIKNEGTISYVDLRKKLSDGRRV
jgi:hypothetical protein